MFGNQAFSRERWKSFQRNIEEKPKNSKMEELIAANQLFCFLLFGEVSDIRKWSIQ